MYRLLASDIDDTILAIDGSLPAATTDVLRRLRAGGIPIVLSSGRATVSIAQIMDRVFGPDAAGYAIAFNGAIVAELPGGAVLFERCLSTQAVAAVAGYARTHDLVLQGYGADDFFCEQRRPECDVYARSTAMRFRAVDDIVAETAGGTPKLLIIHDPQTIEHHRLALTALAAADGGSFVVTISKPNYLEITHPLVGKGVALRFLAGHLGIAVEETVAVGDSFNDIDMISAAGLGVAVGNARPELKARAGLVLTRTADRAAMVELAERLFAQALSNDGPTTT